MSLKIRYGFTADTLSLPTWAINRATGGKYSHCFIIFYNGTRPFYFESIATKDKKTGKTGVRGPYELRKVEDWALKSHRRLLVYPNDGYLPLTTEECDKAYTMLCEAVHEIHYAHLQIVSNWFQQRLKTSLRFGAGSRKRWTCSETATRVIPPRLWHHFQLQDYNADAVVPSGSKGVSVLDAAQAMMEHG